MTVSVQTEAFDIAAETAAVTRGHTNIGAVVSFTGLVRATSGNTSLASLTLEHYPGMTETEIAAIEAEALSRFELLATRVVHRVGTLSPGEPIVLVIAAATHRQAAFDGAAFIMDFLKTRAPFWKKETGRDGAGAWVDERDSDSQSLARWGRPGGSG